MMFWYKIRVTLSNIRRIRKRYEVKAKITTYSYQNVKNPEYADVFPSVPKLKYCWEVLCRNSMLLMIELTIHIMPNRTKLATTYKNGNRWRKNLGHPVKWEVFA
jgi:hypothetical protein